MATALAPLLVGVLASCGSASAPSPPTGVDQLVIPTPSIDPGDFVRGIDNPWLPFEPGATWTYDVTGQQVTGGRGTMTVTVRAGTTRVDGVAATAVQTDTTPPVDGGRARTVDYYAQDDLGNVWWLGREGVWHAGEDGAEAGLAMPADPRRGDGWRTAYQEGVVEDRVQVETVDGALTVPRGHVAHALELDATSDLAPGIVHQRAYARGLGLVREYAEDGPALLIELVSGPVS